MKVEPVRINCYDRSFNTCYCCNIPKVSSMFFKLKVSDKIIHNRGCGILYLQRGHNKIRYEDICAHSWFFREKLTDKIAFSIPWSVLEPEERKYCWEHEDWEGCINSWVDHGFKVALQVRGMDTLGSFYNEGVPQWVFDSGAKYIDEPIDNYRKTFLLNNIPQKSNYPIRYPVYWDKVYLEKVEQFVQAFGERYNGRNEMEYIGIGHMGRWGEMHVAEHNSLVPWIEAGLTLENYIGAHKHIIDIYKSAFPDTDLSQEIGAPAFGEDGDRDYIPLADATEIFDYLEQNNVHIKFNGLGKSWDNSSSPYLSDEVRDIMKHFSKKTKVVMENLVLPKSLNEGLNCGISYWHRGGESQGLGVSRIDQKIPIQDKKIFSFYKFFEKEYDCLDLNMQKDIWRRMAKTCGYHLALKDIEINEMKTGKPFVTTMTWINLGSAACHEQFTIQLFLFDKAGKNIWNEEQSPSCGCGAEIWRPGINIMCSQNWTLSEKVCSDNYVLCFSLCHTKFNKEMITLRNSDEICKGIYRICNVVLANNMLSQDL